MTSCFPGFRQKQGFAGNAFTQTAKKVEPIGFQKMAENELFFKVVISDFENLNNLKKSINIISKQIKENSEFSITEM